jgi:hypothetical protein
MKYLLNLENNLRAKIKLQAVIEGISMNELIEKAIDLYLSTVTNSEFLSKITGDKIKEQGR